MHVFFKKNKRGLYTKRFDTIVADLAKAEGTDEALKASDPMRWVGLMNNYRHSAEEIVFKELVYV